MAAANPAPKALIDKIAALPKDRISDVEDVVDSSSQREQDRALAHAVHDASAPTFAAVWNTPEDDAYDAL